MSITNKSEIVRQHRKEQREALPKEDRQFVALEEIADHLGEIRSQLAQINSTIGLFLRKN